VESAYRISSTWEQLPTDQDIFETITRGMPGSSMPPWADLPVSGRWALVHYVKSLSPRDWPGDAAKLSVNAPDGQTGVISVPEPVDFTDEARIRAATLYAEGCAPCHGATGRGDGQQVQMDSDGFPIRPRDLSRGIYKGKPSYESVYRRIVAGIPGSPMPMSDWAKGEKASLLAQYVLEMSSSEQREEEEIHKRIITVARSEHLPSHPDAREWQAAKAVVLNVTPLWWRDKFASRITVRAMHDGADIAIQIVWPDDTHDHTAIRTEDFRDAVAVQMSSSLSPPFFGMGETDRPVNIWMWKAERQANLANAFQDIEAVYPNIGIDSYPNVDASPLEQPARHALTLKSNPTFVTGWGAGNIVSDPTYRLSAEDLTAEGFGTLSACPLAHQAVESIGRYGTSSYSVTFKRSMRSAHEEQLNLKPGSALSVGFAVWDGSSGDRDGKKCVTIWHELRIEP
jgi:mono/diheme cytochrome c family protein